MDLAESILNELVSLQKKNEELVAIITRLEHESDVIIHQFEDKISDLNKKIKKVQDNAAKSEKKFEAQIRESKKERDELEKAKEQIELDFSGKISHLEEIIEKYDGEIARKNQTLLELEEKNRRFQLQLIEESEFTKEKISEFQAEIVNEREKSETEYKNLSIHYSKQISTLKDEIERKDSELRALANELKNKIALEQDTIKEQIKQKKILEELNDILDLEHRERIKIESDFAQKSEKMENVIGNLQNQISSLEKTSADIISERDVKITSLETENSRINETNTKNLELISELQRENNSLRESIEQHLSDISTKSQEIDTLRADMDALRFSLESRISDLIQENEHYQTDLAEKVRKGDKLRDEMEDLRGRLEDRILELSGIIEEKDEVISRAEHVRTTLEADIGTIIRENDEKISSLELTIDELQQKELLLINQAEEREDAAAHEISRLSLEIQDLQSDLTGLTHTIEQKNQREQEYRDEIAHLHEEHIKGMEEWKEHLESKSRDLAERDRHISLISGNNEALRSELERIRSRLILLEKTIREDKEEPVHALYRQIQSLSAKLAGKESENSALASRIMRLDTENTHLTRLLAESELAEYQRDPTPVTGDRQGWSAEQVSLKPQDISEYLSNLDDPMQAMQAAAEILKLGPQTIEILIPLLYRGPLNRRAWVAVLLYEMNDQRATKPLSDLLDSSESGLRELIWDTRLRFREWRRSNMASSVAQYQ